MNHLIRSGAMVAMLMAAGCGNTTATTQTISDLAPSPDLGVPADLQPAPDQEVPPALVRVVHASPDLPAVDLYIHPSNTPFATNVVYGGATVYAPATPGILNIDVRYAGADPNNFPTWNSTPIQINSGDKLTMALSGLFTNGSAAVKLRGVPLFERFATASTGQARVRVVNASADAPAISVDIGNTGTPQAMAVANFTDSGADGVVIPSGAAATVSVLGGMPAAFLTQFTAPALLDQESAFLIVTGLFAHLPRESNGISFLLVGAAGATAIAQDPSVYVLHAGPDAGALDVFAGTSELGANLTFGTLSPRIQVKPGSYTLDFFAHQASSMRPAGNPLFSSASLTLAGGQRYLVSASGYVTSSKGRPAIKATVLQEGFTLDATKAWLTVLDADADGPALDVGPASGGSLTAVVANAIAWNSSSVPSGISMPLSPALDGGVVPLGLGFAATGTDSVLGSFPVPFAAGNRLIAVPAGSTVAQNGEPGFTLFTIDSAKWPWTLTTYAP